MNNYSLEELAMIANSVRKNSLTSIYHAASGHPGGGLSCADILVTLFFSEMNFDFENLDSLERDRFILSKGHSAPTLYAIGEMLGLLTMKELKSLRKLGSRLQGHTDRVTMKWVEASTGSLGQGFSIAAGEALGLKLKRVNSRIFVLLGDGEMQEGMVWETLMFAAHHRLSNLVAMLDYNKMQSDDLNENIIGLEPLKDKIESFGWNVIETDGHDFAKIRAAFITCKRNEDKPNAIIFHTCKGKNVSFMEGSPLWHGSVKMSIEDIETSLIELGATQEEIDELIR